MLNSKACIRGLVAFAIFLVFATSPSFAVGQFSKKGTYSIQTKSKKITGSPMAWDGEKVFLLSAYGKFESINFSDVEGFKKKSDLKVVFSKSSFAKKLKAEFGDRYQVTTTQDYLVVHPVGQSDYWPQKIQGVYNSFRAYFYSRRISIAKRSYPFVAIVFGSRSEFDRYATKNKEKISQNVVGYYSINSNRVLMYDQSGSRDASENFETIVHEISHQAAFNCGIHSRFGDTPRWVAEGLGTMFEANGVWDYGKHPKQTDRLNSGLYQQFNQNILKRKQTGWIGQLVSGNRLFEKNPSAAYSSSWALSFYLMETKPREYVSYMKKLNKLEPFQTYKKEKRLNDFTHAFGGISSMEGAIINFFKRFN